MQTRAPPPTEVAGGPPSSAVSGAPSSEFAAGNHSQPHGQHGDTLLHADAPLFGQPADLQVGHQRLLIAVINLSAQLGYGTLQVHPTSCIRIHLTLLQHRNSLLEGVKSSCKRTAEGRYLRAEFPHLLHAAGQHTFHITVGILKFIMLVARAEVLGQYKKLLLYSKSLALTDPVYFKNRITSEFKKNKTLTVPEDIRFAYQKGEALLRRGAVL
ncbi:unnamed protein product [Chilo suppressalis]|uniref:Complex 1 LYR protein domain-containing protein n=1 Tax=Chilo suppressalis TaxID=168631 RepID=A0ABN8BH13_CHISP|nr:unnamed protein product [Chilo suppressalis]